NMRYGACNPEDISFLRSGVISNRPGHPTFTNPKYRMTPIITSWNAHKDKINEIGSQRFAEDTGQTLTHFYACDTLAGNSDSGYRLPMNLRRKEKLPPSRKLSLDQQNELWKAHPSTSEHIAGRLSLCVGLPVMIRNNDATELCITKGQEATVVGWQASTGPDGQNILDTLFVKLINPPRKFFIPGLEENIVSLGKATKKIWCSLPNDMVVSVSREQVLVLPNFA
ncbi:hypothetical protein B0H10DRAFT_1741073, partial [Mycena sp. CBHHK59/15]